MFFACFFLIKLISKMSRDFSFSVYLKQTH